MTHGISTGWRVDVMKPSRCPCPCPTPLRGSPLWLSPDLLRWRRRAPVHRCSSLDSGHTHRWPRCLHISRASFSSHVTKQSSRDIFILSVDVCKRWTWTCLRMCASPGKSPPPRLHSPLLQSRTPAALFYSALFCYHLPSSSSSSSSSSYGVLNNNDLIKSHVHAVQGKWMILTNETFTLLIKPVFLKVHYVEFR